MTGLLVLFFALSVAHLIHSLRKASERLPEIVKLLALLAQLGDFNFHVLEIFFA